MSNKSLNKNPSQTPHDQTKPSQQADSASYQTSDVDRLIYEKSNTYRLHADTLRWTLLGSFVALFSFVFTSLPADEVGSNLTTVGLLLVIFLVTNIFLVILAVQNWFYNLFASFVAECEDHLIARKPLRSLESFAREKGSSISPFHPAFFFALVALTLIAAISLIYAVKLTFATQWAGLLPVGKIALSAGVLGINLLIFFLWFKNWDRWVFKPFIRPLSYLFKPVQK